MKLRYDKATRSIQPADEKYRFHPCGVCGRSRQSVRGDWLRSRRTACGVGLREMARRIGVSAPYLGDVELGRRRATERVVSAYEKLRLSGPGGSE